MNRFLQLALAAFTAFASTAAIANPFDPNNPNAVPEPGVLGLVGVALAAAVYFGKRRK